MSEGEPRLQLIYHQSAQVNLPSHIDHSHVTEQVEFILYSNFFLLFITNLSEYRGERSKNIRAYMDLIGKCRAYEYF